MDLKPSDRKCGGTPARDSYKFDYGYDEIKTQSVPSDVAIKGCGADLLTVDVRKTRPSAGHRALFVKTAPVFICPNCDAGS